MWYPISSCAFQTKHVLKIGTIYFTLVKTDYEVLSITTKNGAHPLEFCYCYITAAVFVSLLLLFKSIPYRFETNDRDKDYNFVFEKPFFVQFIRFEWSTTIRIYRWFCNIHLRKKKFASEMSKFKRSYYYDDYYFRSCGFNYTLLIKCTIQFVTNKLLREIIYLFG